VKSADVTRIRLCDKTVREFNPVHKYNPRKGPRVALFYPAPYSVASQSLGFQLLYAYFVSYGVRVERFTYDSCGTSLESGKTLKEFDVVVVSSSFELDYPYLSEYLRKYGREGQRVIAGGIAPTSNPIPILDVVTNVVLADVEIAVPSVVDALFSGDWESFESLEFVVSGEDDEGKRAYANVAEEPLLSTQFVPLDFDPPWGKGFLVEVTRGCPWKCRFCLEGWVTKPFRQRDVEQVKRALANVRRPFEKVITISLSLGNYESVDEYLDSLIELKRKRKVQGSVPSLRLETVTEELLEKVKGLGQRTVTVAPETFDPLKARVLGKGYAPEFFKEKVSIINKLNLKLKVYMMVVPGEPARVTEGDAEVLKELAPGSHVSVNPLVPKPWTPLQGAPIPGEREERALSVFAEKLRYVDLYPVKWARLQAALGLARRPLGKHLAPTSDPEGLIRELNERGLISLKELESWRTDWDEPWLRFRVGDLKEIKRLGEDSYEAWKELISS